MAESNLALLAEEDLSKTLRRELLSFSVAGVTAAIDLVGSRVPDAPMSGARAVCRHKVFPRAGLYCPRGPP